MLIVCPSCASSYQVEAASLGPAGRSVRCAHCRNVWFATAPAIVPALTEDDFDLVDTGPRVPSFDAARPAPMIEAMPEAASPAGEAETSGWEVEALAEEAAAASPEEFTQAMGEEFAPALASTDGIDLEGLSAEMEAEQAELAAAADAVLAEVTGETIVADAPPLVPPAEPESELEAEPPIAASAPPRDDIETYAVRRAPRAASRRQHQWAMPGLPVMILALVAANAILFAWRNDIVRLMPQTASLYNAVGLAVNLRGLAFENMKMSKDEHDGVAVLVVEGTIANVTGRAVEVPRLRLAVRNESKNEIYSWTALPSRTILGPGETLPFRSRLASPPAETRDVLVRFFSRRDMVAGLN